MEKILDYKKNKYEVLRELEGRYYLLTAENNYYIIDLKDVSSKPFKSVFNRDAQKQFDIEPQLRPLANEAAAEREWKELLINLELSALKKEEKEYFEERMRGAGNTGFSKLEFREIDTAQGISINAVNIAGEFSKIKIESENTNLENLTHEELSSYAKAWVGGYNRFWGDEVKAAQLADIEFYASSCLAGALKDNENLSRSLTIAMVENFDKSNYYAGTKSKQALEATRYIFDYMKKNHIRFYSDKRLLGNCDSLDLRLVSYDDIYIKNKMYQDERHEYIVSDNKRKVQNFFDSKEIKLYAPDRTSSQNIQNSVVIYAENGIEVCADKYTDQKDGSSQCEITVNSKYKFFASEKQVIGRCSEAALKNVAESIGKNQNNMLDWSNVKTYKQDQMRINIGELERG